MGKQVQIDEALFKQIYGYFLDMQDEQGYNMDAEAADILNKVEQKVDKIINRELFTEYKTAPSQREREAARQKYLDRRGVLPSFRTEQECRVIPPFDE